MKKIQLFLLVLVLLAACKKETAPVSNSNQTAKYVKAIQGSFIAKDGDITLKSLPDGATRTWIMYAKNSLNYADPSTPNDPPLFALVKGKEFITGTTAQIWWATPGNNPVTFPATTSVYSNLTPVENLRVVTETRLDANDPVVAYLGMLDFNPQYASFPLTVHSYRLGDVLQINTDALTKLPGGSGLTITVAFNKAKINLSATENADPLSGTNTGTPNGNEFLWKDIVYYPLPNPATPTTMIVPNPSGNYVLYDGYDSKVKGTVIITITIDGATIEKDVPAPPDGQGMLMVLKTTKVGWYDSATIGLVDTDVTVNTVEVPIN